MGASDRYRVIRAAAKTKFRPDRDLDNADWPKRTDDRITIEYDKLGRPVRAVDAEGNTLHDFTGGGES